MPAAPMDDKEYIVFARDLSNHWSMFGAAALVRKLGRGWITQFQNHGHPTVFKTKREAMEMATAWVLETARHRREMEA